MAEFTEEKHPRDESGKFTDKNGSYRQNASYEEIMTNDRKRLYSELAYDLSQVRDIKALLGKEYTGYKGQAAIDKLLEEKQGHIKAAFHRDDIGDIDLIWGNDWLGLQHIIKQRQKQDIDTTGFLSNIAEVVDKGKFLKKSNRGTLEYWYNGKSVVFSPEYHGNKLTYLLTAFKKTLPKNKTPK